MTQAQQIRDYHADKPTATASEIAKALNVLPQTVYKVLEGKLIKKQYAAQKVKKPRKPKKLMPVAEKDLKPLWDIRTSRLDAIITERDEEIKKLNIVIQYLEQRLSEYSRGHAI